MALCGAVGALALPSEIIVHIFSFLSDRDKLRASAVCWRWRECAFYPALWTRLALRLGSGADGGGSGPEHGPKLEFLMRKFGSFVRELRLEFAPVDGCCLSPASETVDSEPGLPDRWTDAMATYLEQVLCVLGGLRNNRNLERLSLYGDTCVLQDDSILDSSYVSQVDQGGKKIKELQQLFEEVLCNSRSLRWLSCTFLLGVATPHSLSALSNASARTLEHLSLLDEQLPGLVSCTELQRLSNLCSLALDYCDFTPEMCRLLSAADRAPLRRLSLLLNGAALDAGPPDVASEADLGALVRRSAGLRVYLMALDVRGEDLLLALKPSLPLERLHLENYGAPLSDRVLELVSQQYHKTLTHLVLVREDAGFPDLSLNRNEDPLVLLAWRCVRLAVLVVHGYTVWSHNLVAISRLRGANLRVLAVSEESIDFDPDQSVFGEGDPVHNLVKEVSLGLGRVWHPSLDGSLVLSEPTQHFHREMQSFSETTNATV